MSEPEPTRADYRQAVAERDQAIAERDFILKFVEDVAGAFYRGDALAAVIHIRTLRAMVAVANA
jgi:hypothetical protein